MASATSPGLSFLRAAIVNPWTGMSYEPMQPWTDDSRTAPEGMILLAGYRGHGHHHHHHASPVYGARTPDESCFIGMASLVSDMGRMDLSFEQISDQARPNKPPLMHMMPYQDSGRPDSSSGSGSSAERWTGYLHTNHSILEI